MIRSKRHKLKLSQNFFFKEHLVHRNVTLHRNITLL